jgi:hypothetical protein
VTKKALDTPEKKASLEKSIAEAFGFSLSDRFTVEIISILEKIITNGGKIRRRLDTAGAEIIYEVRIQETQASGTPDPSVASIMQSKMSLLAAAAAASADNASGERGSYNGWTILSEIESAVATQAGIDVASIKTEVTAPEQIVSIDVKKVDEKEEDGSNSDQSNKIDAEDGGTEYQGEIGGIIGAIAGSLALFGVAGIAFWIYRNVAEKREHGHQNSFTPVQSNQASIEMAVAMHSRGDSTIEGFASTSNKLNNPKSIGAPALPPPPHPPAPGLKRNVQVALYDYEANGVGEISITAGDTLIPTEHLEHNADWTTGTNVRTKEVGYYPTQYVRDIR